jgi:hypothetical protein
MTDTSREDRETKSFTTTFSQMYQLFNGYHLGTNRALFVIAPRPRTVSSDFDLIRGERKLEGIQDMFLVVYVPKQLSGICLQASLDTGHVVLEQSGTKMVLSLKSDDGAPRQPNGQDEDIGQGSGGGGGASSGDGSDKTEVSYLVVTRRLVRTCVRFAENDRLVLVAVPALPDGETPPDGVSPLRDVVFESEMLATESSQTLARMVRDGGLSSEEKVRLANQFNVSQQRIMDTMLSGFSAGRYRPRRFVDTRTFRALVAETLSRAPITIEQFRRPGVLSARTLQALRRGGVGSVSDLFAIQGPAALRAERDQLIVARRAVLNHVIEAAQRRSDTT